MLGQTFGKSEVVFVGRSGVEEERGLGGNDLVAAGLQSIQHLLPAQLNRLEVRLCGQELAHGKLHQRRWRAKAHGPAETLELSRHQCAIRDSRRYGSVADALTLHE